MHFVLLVHDCDLITALQFCNGALRHKQGIVLGVELNPDTGELTGTKGMLKIRKKRFELESAGGWAYLSVRRIYLALPRADSRS